jgi:hypothetical protein
MTSHAPLTAGTRPVALPAAGGRPAGIDPQTPSSLHSLLRELYAAGRQDLAAARLLEGHVDALQLLRRYGRDPRVHRLADRLEASGSCGVWNADLPGDPLRIENKFIVGGKSFASGAGLLTHALVTVRADDPARVQLILVDLARSPPEIDRDWWRVVGMQASHTHRVHWQQLPLDGVTLIGGPGDYAREPWFSGGALRFVAVQAGGLAGLFDAVRAHLIAREREGDPHQLARLARLYTAADTASALCARAAGQWFETEGETRLAYVGHVRLAVSDLAVSAIALAQEAIGVEALFEAHPACRILTDLMVYIRQPGPDRKREALGKALALGCLRPLL